MIRSGRFTSILKVTAGALAVVLVVLLGAGIYLYSLSRTLPDLDMASDSQTTARTSIVYAVDGSVLAEWHGEEDRTVVALDTIPQHTRDAVLAIEDERFYSHNGVDAGAIARALGMSTADAGAAPGGSTITQQLVKIMSAKGERTVSRKIREALLAYQLEANANKDAVLEAYLNTVYFGHGAYGIESAAQRYFGVSASELTVAQSATLAGLLAAPSAYSPTDAPEAAAGRRDAVLERMHALGSISTEEHDIATQTELTVAPPQEVPETAPYFVEWVKQQLIDELGADAVFKGGLRVHTTLDPTLQARAEQAVKAHLGGPNDPETALVAVEHSTGNVVAMVGGRDFQTNQFNLAAQGTRQPGSAFKPFVLVAALEEGVAPDKIFDTSPYTVEVEDGVWRVQNYENEFTEGTLTLRAATNWSVNAVFARLIMLVGPEKVVDVAHRMGIESELEANPAIALGGLSHGVTPLEMAVAYGTIASGGMRAEPVGVLRVTDDTDRVVWESDTAPDRVLEEPVALQAALMLHDVVESGTGVEARLANTWAAGKTGTTQSYRDAWFCGYAEGISCATWVGYREAQVEMVDVHGIQVTGGSYPARIWRTFMEGALQHQSAAVTPEAAVVPEAAAPETPSAGNVVTSVCPDSMMLANQRCPAPIEMYLDAGLVPESTCTRH